MTELPRGRDNADVDLLGPTTELISHLPSQARVHGSLPWEGSCPPSADQTDWVPDRACPALLQLRCTPWPLGFHQRGQHSPFPCKPHFRSFHTLHATIPPLRAPHPLGLCAKKLSPGFDGESLTPAMRGKGQSRNCRDCGSNDITQSVILVYFINKYQPCTFTWKTFSSNSSLFLYFNSPRKQETVTTLGIWTMQRLRVVSSLLGWFLNNLIPKLKCVSLQILRNKCKKMP